MSFLLCTASPEIRPMKMSSVSTPAASPSTTPLPIHPKSQSMDLSYNVNTMEDELTCPVCLELFADPLMLPCSHSICKKCLQDILASRKKQSQEGLECPSCRKQHCVPGEKISRLPRNLALENVVFRYQEIKVQTLTKSRSLDASFEHSHSPTDPPDLDISAFSEESSNENCGLCDVDPPAKAVWFCQQCNVLYCKACLEKFHPKRGALARHKLTRPVKVDRETKAVLCEDHENEVVSIFCRVCKILVCPLCMCEGLGKHSGHQVVDQDTALKETKETVSDTKESLETMFSKLSDQNRKLEEVLDETESLHRDATQKVEQQYRCFVDDIVSTLRQQRDAMLSHLGELKSGLNKQLRSQIEDNRRRLKRMENMTDTCKNILQEDGSATLLERAQDVEPIKKLVKQYTKHMASSEEVCESVSKDKTIQKELKSSLSQFRNQTEATLELFLQNESHRCSEIRPAFQSPTSPGKVDAPRVQNKCLMTWGFNSTTFTAEELKKSVSLTVTIEKNSSHIGDVKTGYLFGVGLATDMLNSKDLVGMNSRSYGLACTSGNLVFVHDSKTETLMPLENLPLSVTMYVNLDAEDFVVLAYMVTSTSWGDTLQGKKFLSKKLIKDSLFPVFTVSQRVKIQFPTYV